MNRTMGYPVINPIWENDLVEITFSKIVLSGCNWNNRYASSLQGKNDRSQFDEFSSCPDEYKNHYKLEYFRFYYSFFAICRQLWPNAHASEDSMIENKNGSKERKRNMQKCNSFPCSYRHYEGVDCGRENR